MTHLSETRSGIRPIFVTLVLAVQAVPAAELVDWNLDTVTGPVVNNTPFAHVPAATATLAANLSVDDLVTANSPGHAGLVWSAGNPGPGQLNLQRWDHPDDDPALTGNGNGNPNNWLQFTLTATAGYEFEIESIGLSAWRNGTGAPAAWSFQTSDDNGDTWTPFGSVHTEGNLGDSIYRQVSFTGPVSAGTLLVRFIANGPTGGTGNLHINSIVLHGTVSQITSPDPVVLVEETFGGLSGTGLSGTEPATNLLSSGTDWVASSSIAANGQVTDAANTDRGAHIDLKEGFTFAQDSTYTLTLGWENLDNAIVFAGFMVDTPDVEAQMQTQGTNFGLRARRITAGTDTLAAWERFESANTATVGTTITPASGTVAFTLETRSLTDATFTVDGVSRVVDLTANYRYLWIGYEDPTSGESDAKFTSLILSGPAPPPQSDPPVVTILPESTLVPAGQLITLSANVESSAIHYTLDGGVPDVGSTLYTTPFPLNASATVRALAIDETLGAGPVAIRTYTLQEPIGTPNLLVIVADDVGIGDLQCYGGVNIATPALDSLAYDGIRFTQFTTTGPGNLASQYALLTGRVAARSGLGTAVAPDGSGWQAEEWTLAEMLRRRGYSTAFIGEWQLGNANGSHPNDQGFQLFHGLPYAVSDSPLLEENRQVVDAAPDPALLLDTLTTRATTFIAAAESPFALVFQAPALPATGTSIGGPHGNRVEALDAAAGQLLAELTTNGLAEDTLVLFLSDGGAERTASGGSNGILRDGDGTTWEGGLRAPLIARLPGTLPPGQMNLSLVWLPDLTPTLASLLGGNLAADRSLDGTPRPAALTGSQTRPAGDETAYGFRYEDNSWQLATVRQGKWKSHLSIVNIDPLNTNPISGSQLYDLHVDAEERINRASQQGAVLTQLQDLATAFTASLPAPGTADLPAPKPPVLNGVSTTLESSTSTVQFVFSRPADSLDEDYRIEHSDNLTSWESLSITPYVTSLTPSVEQAEDLELHVPLGVPPLDGGSRFIRFRAERPANP